MNSFCRFSNKIQYLELFQANITVIQNLNISVNLSMNNELILEEPLSVASVITFGIEGDCIMKELIVNVSIDDIYGNDNSYVNYIHNVCYAMSLKCTAIVNTQLQKLAFYAMSIQFSMYIFHSILILT